MTLGSPAAIIYRKHTFLSALALGFSAIVVAAIVSCTVILLYTVYLAGEKSERLITLAQGAIHGLPEFTESLPPVLSDMLNDHRQPDYAASLTITAKPTAAPDSRRMARTAIEVVNHGQEVVSLLGLRVTVFDPQGRLVSESQEWAATPVAADGGWRGPIMPGSRRSFVSCRYCGYDMAPLDDARIEVEITELRLWNARPDAPTTAYGPRQEIPEPAFCATVRRPPLSAGSSPSPSTDTPRR